MCVLIKEKHSSTYIKACREKIDKVFGFRPLGLYEQFTHWLDLCMSLDSHDF